MRLWLGVTDNDWFKVLSRADVDEVNFWQPSDRAPFVGLETGAPFLFKLKRPYNHIAGGGTFVKFFKLPLSLAWEVFETKNGAESRDDFEALIRRLGSDPKVRDPEIGCTVLAAPFFWPMESWIANPIGWSGNIVRGRYYDTETTESVEAAELLEHFVWSNDQQAPYILEEYRAVITDEIADIAILLTYLTHDLSIDLQTAVSKKLEVNERKYPIEKSYGSNKKYTDL